MQRPILFLALLLLFSGCLHVPPTSPSPPASTPIPVAPSAPPTPTPLAVPLSGGATPAPTSRDLRVSIQGDDAGAVDIRREDGASPDLPREETRGMDLLEAAVDYTGERITTALTMRGPPGPGVRIDVLYDLDGDQREDIRAQVRGETVTLLRGNTTLGEAGGLAPIGRGTPTLSFSILPPAAPTAKMGVRIESRLAGAAGIDIIDTMPEGTGTWHRQNSAA